MIRNKPDLSLVRDRAYAYLLTLQGFYWPPTLTAPRIGKYWIFALLHSGEVKQAHGPSWLVFRIAKVLIPQNGDRIAGECIWA